MKTVFVTGGTGFLGSFLIARLLEAGDSVVALARGPDAEGRLRAAVGHALRLPDLGADHTRRLEVIPGDVTDPALGHDHGSRARFLQKIDAVW